MGGVHPTTSPTKFQFFAHGLLNIIWAVRSWESIFDIFSSIFLVSCAIYDTPYGRPGVCCSRHQQARKDGTPWQSWGGHRSLARPTASSLTLVLMLRNMRRIWYLIHESMTNRMANQIEFLSAITHDVRSIIG